MEEMSMKDKEGRKQKERRSSGRGKREIIKRVIVWKGERGRGRGMERWRRLMERIEK